MKIDELDLLEAVLKLPEEKLHTIMAHILEDNGYDNIVTTDSYIIAKGDIDICVVAHMDIIHPHPPVKVVLNTNKNKLWSPSGLGADDRAGVFLILLLIKDGLRPHLILTLGEEAGGVGVSTLVQDIHEPPFPVKYMIELDRANENDCVFYDCDNKEFRKYIESFGFETELGTYTDITFIAPEWKVAAVNLSVGYVNEHTNSEVLHLDWMMSTYKKLDKMLRDCKNIEKFEYIQKEFEFEEIVMCEGCGKFDDIWATLPINDNYGNPHYYCLDCLASDKIGWCRKCGSPYVVNSTGVLDLCPNCNEEELWLKVQMANWKQQI